MKIIRLCAATIVFPLCFLPLSCDLFGGDVVYLASQAEEIFNELMGQSHGILPDSYVLYDVSKTYTGDESEEDKIDGSARLYGTYTYTWDDYYISSDSHKEVRSWTYDELKFSYDDYKRFSNDITIVSGSLTVDGSRQMETQYTTSGYTSYSTRTESGSLHVYGTVVVEGVCDGEDVHDTVTLDVTRSLTGTSWFYNGTLSNRVETWDIYME